MTRRRRRPPDLLDTLPPISDQAAAAMADLLAELLCRFEGRYYFQIRRYYEQHRPRRGLPAPRVSTDPPF